MIRTLALHENLEETLVRLSELLQQPVYASGTCSLKGTHYKRPGSDDYITDLDPLELFLSRWTDRGFCVRVDGNQKYFDLTPSPILQVITPQLESKSSFGVALKAVGLSDYVWDCHSLFVHPERVPTELTPYIKELKKRVGSKLVTRTGIGFLRSLGWIYNPLVRHESWHLGLGVEPRHGASFTTLQSPGFYNGAPVTAIEDINCWAISDCDPGPCIICRGRSKERRHLGTFQGSYLKGHMCKICAKQAFEAWSKILDEPLPDREL